MTHILFNLLIALLHPIRAQISSTLEVICETNSTDITKTTTYDISHLLPNNYNQFDIIDHPETLDKWSINVSIPLLESNTSEPNTYCYLHLFLSDDDYWGFQPDALCNINFNINENTQDVDTTTTINDIIALHIIDIHSEYNMIWVNMENDNDDNNNNSLNEYTLFTYPQCNDDEWGNYNITQLFESKFEILMDDNDSNSLFQDEITIIKQYQLTNLNISNIPTFPYYFGITNDDNGNTSQFTSDTYPTNTGTIRCDYSESLPLNTDSDSDSESDSDSIGIDYYLVIVNKEDNKDNIDINIEIIQSCDITPLPTESPTSAPTGSDDDDDDDGLAGDTIVIIILAVLMIILGVSVLVTAIYRHNKEQEEEEKQKKIEAQLAEIELNKQRDESNTATTDASLIDNPFTINNDEHHEMVQMMKQNSLSVGLQAD